MEYAYAQSVLGRIQLARKAWTEAEGALRNALAIREVTIPNLLTTFHTESLLGAALLGQKKYADAEPLLRAGYAGLKSRAETLSPARKHYLRDALDRLIELAEATGKADRAKAWKEERAKMEANAASKSEDEKMRAKMSPAASVPVVRERYESALSGDWIAIKNRIW